MGPKADKGSTASWKGRHQPWHVSTPVKHLAVPSQSHLPQLCRVIKAQSCSRQTSFIHCFVFRLDPMLSQQYEGELCPASCARDLVSRVEEKPRGELRSRSSFPEPSPRTTAACPLHWMRTGEQDVNSPPLQDTQERSSPEAHRELVFDPRVRQELTRNFN